MAGPGKYRSGNLQGENLPPMQDSPGIPKRNTFGGGESGGEYGMDSENGIIDLSNDSAIDASCQGYKGQPGLFLKRGHDPLEVDPGSQSYPAPMEKDKPEGSPATTEE